MGLVSNIPDRPGPGEQPLLCAPRDPRLSSAKCVSLAGYAIWPAWLNFRWWILHPQSPLGGPQGPFGLEQQLYPGSSSLQCTHLSECAEPHWPCIWPTAGSCQYLSNLTGRSLGCGRQEVLCSYAGLLKAHFLPC